MAAPASECELNVRFQITGKARGTTTIGELASELFIFDLFLNFGGSKFGSGAVSKKRPGFPVLEITGSIWVGRASRGRSGTDHGSGSEGRC